MLITGESGAGKTENTKKVISYLAMVATSGKKTVKKATLEDQIVATNPILESYGNAKTSRNDNSSRFGKFIRIHFNVAGKLSGCDIKAYLFEKSRITQQQEVERSYHIFYQLLQPAVEDIQEKCLLTDSIYDYSYVSQGRTKVDSIDDNEELQFTDAAFEIIGFSETEKWSCYKLTAAVMTMGELKFKQKGREEQCEPDKPELSSKVGELCGVDPQAMMNAFVKPRIKVGTEWVTKGQNIEQAMNAVGGIARAIYHRNFLWLIEKCNETLIDPSMKKVNFCAVLDIAGFEIFTFNGYEQISINFVNEKLQQFFNHHMFVVEQEEYISEGIDWQMVDFGMDLAACIIMFEKPMGVWAILEEESLFPKASDKSLEEKLKSTLLGKCPSFAKPQSKTDKNAHFAVIHYAGTVSYNVTAWLEKNKDPVNDTVVDILKRSSCNLLVHLWRDHPGQTFETAEGKGEGGKKKKGGGGKTVSSVFLVDLNALMTTLHATDPHFVRCIVPNTHKQPGGVEPALIMHQLTCNGVLEGIRICMRGFPNRLPYADFQKRYSILARGKVSGSTDEKKAADTIIKNTAAFDIERYRPGHTKVFFRAGALAVLEEVRDDIVTDLMCKLQGAVRGHKSRKLYKERVVKREMIKVIQSNFKKFLKMKNWKWFNLIRFTKPLIGQTNMEEVLEQLQEKCEKICSEYNEAVSTKSRMENENNIMKAEIHQVRSKLSGEQGDIGMQQEIIAKSNQEIAEMKANLKEMQYKLSEEESAKEDIEEENKEIESKQSNMSTKKGEVKERLDELLKEVSQKNKVVEGLNEEILQNDEKISKMTSEKRLFNEKTSKSSEDLQSGEDKLHYLVETKKKLENIYDEMQLSMESEKKTKQEVEITRRSMEVELKSAHSVVHDLDRQKQQMEQIVIKMDNEMRECREKLEKEECSMGRNQKIIRELQYKEKKIDSEIDTEKQSRLSAEIQRSDLAREAEKLVDHLDEANSNTFAQIEMNNKLEAKAQEMRRDQEELNISSEATLHKLRKKHQEAYDEMSEQIDTLRKMKMKTERDIVAVEMEIHDTKTGHEKAVYDISLGEKNLKALKDNLAKTMKKIESDTDNLKSFGDLNKKLIIENGTKLEDTKVLLTRKSAFEAETNSLQSLLDTAKHECENEERGRQSLLTKYRTVEHEFDGIKEQYDDEQMEKEDMLQLLHKSLTDASIWRNKYEKEVVEKIEDLEMTKIKLQTRLTESEDIIECQSKKLQTMEDRKIFVMKALEEITRKVENSNYHYTQAEKRVKCLDKEVAEFKIKADGISQELMMSQNQCRNAAAELFRTKNGYEDALIKLEDVKKENLNLATEIRDIHEQINDGGRTIHVIENQRKKLEEDKIELGIILEDIETALEEQESKLQELNLQSNLLKNDIETRIKSMEDSFEVTKSNHTKAMDSIQQNIESMSKSKAEANRDRQTLEQTVLDIEGALNQSQLKSVELHITAKKLQEQIRNKTVLLESENNAKEIASVNLVNIERKLNTVRNSLEEGRTLLEQADRSRRQNEQELGDTNDQLNDFASLNSSLLNTVRKLQAETSELKLEKQDVSNEVLLIEEREKNNMMEAAQIADELRSEQEDSAKAEEDKKATETNLRDLQIKVDDAETNAIKWGEKIVAKLALRVKEVETELELERRRHGDANKSLRKTQRGIHEYSIKMEENIKNSERMQNLVEKLQNQIMHYKKQIEEAEEIGSLNLCKFRRVEGDLMDSHDRAMLKEQMLAKLRGRANSVGP